MPTTTPFRPVRLALGALVATTAHAHGPDHDVQLHVGYDHASCYIDLHPELTAPQFRDFGREFADAGVFLPMAGADPLGGGHVRVGLTYNQTFLDDTEPQWNNTFSHPGGHHWLGSPALPTLQGRVGLSDRVDAELMATGGPGSNWAILGAAARVAWLREGAPLSLASRATVTHLLGAPELDVESLGLEALASRRFGAVTPYAGVGLATTWAAERTDELALDHATAVGGRATVGAEVALGSFRVTGQGMWASVPSLAVFLGGSF